jgi:hypothetical protein
VLIGLNGRKQAGKDTVFERVARLMADVVEVERVSFADLLYRSAAASLGVTVELLQVLKSVPDARVRVVDRRGDWLGANNTGTYADQSVREYLQHYGTEAHRDEFGPDFWVEQVNLEHEGRIVVVTDVRFVNEAEAIQRAGGTVVEVIGPEGRVTDDDAHASEAPLPEELIDVTLTNTVRDDGFRRLDGQVDTLLRLHLGGALHSVRA